MSLSDAPKVTEQDVDAYGRDGAVCLRQVLRPHEVEWLRQGIDAHPSPRAIVALAAIFVATVI